MENCIKENRMKNKLRSMKNFKVQSYIGAAALSLLVLASSCNKDFDKVIPDSPENQNDINYKAPKVLYIIADGARGQSVRDAAATNIKSLLPNAIYSWNSLADVTENDATNWADMMTGVKKDKHKVLTPDFAGNKLSDYPVIFKRIKSLNPNLRIASFASSTAFKENLTTDADISESFTSDDLLKNRMTEFLKSDTAAIVVGEFSGVEKAGQSVGFDNKFPGYLDAINTFDAQVGELLNTIKARPSYAKENWLIIITSNRGGSYTLPPDQDDKTLFSNTNANTFMILASGNYKQTFIGKPFLGNLYNGSAIRFKGDPEKSVGYVTSPEANKFYNFGTKDFTVSVKIRKGKPKNTSQGDYWYQWPSILGKRDDSGWGDSGHKPGWDISLFYNGWRFMCQGGDNGDEIAGREFSGETWHDLTFAVERKADGRRYARLYTDGVKGITNRNNGSISNPYMDDYLMSAASNFDNGDRMRVGWTSGEIDGDKGYINVQLAELKIWQKALSESVIQQYACDPTMDESHPDYPYLVGYWPMVEGSGGLLTDKSPVGGNFTMQGTYQWEPFNALICTPSNSNLGTLVPKNSDIPTQILSWFNIARQESWALDGRVWISN
jgi:hypothetical protein